ncbi:MAG: nitroreductase family protein, partial [Deltaproteobacteria bacterium]|nr:nitroreductase family protein [Deltaproteobacteria bacterium]
GHISQNLYLQAASLGLGSVAVGAFDDGRVNQMLGLDGENTSAMYLHCIGFPEK